MGTFLAGIAAANWGSSHVAVVLGSLVIPAGVVLAGVLLTARDIVQDTLGSAAVAAAIGGGMAASLMVAPPRLVLASTTAFLVAELVDWWLYTRFRRRSRSAAIAVSNLGGLVLDSAVFVPWAFGSLALLPGHLAGKAVATVMALAAAAALTARRRGGVLP
ncbi:VUT family protein [Amycolatopsis thermalba]|uniref:VUT family protein n=1 Tax=Amycolatopsis thermalba TaxID=944492 RepID=A0ABY4P1A6_9PSEU|nr:MULTISPECIES: VUT family protein [Amycolatopsis]UQS26018.1 VUT family protein [Amycolatopsis thermalba]